MRDDGSLDNRRGLDGLADRSDDTPSIDRSAASRETSLNPHTRPDQASGLRFLLTRLGTLRNPFAGRPARPRVAVATGVVCCLGLVGLAQVNLGSADDSDLSANRTEIAQRAEQDAASRGSARQSAAPAADPANPDIAPSPVQGKPKAEPKLKPKPKPKPKRIAPVAGLDQAQMENAKVIVRTGRDMGVPRRGLVIAVATAMQESNLYNYASGVLPESQNYPHQAIGWDHDSVGLFQQRPSTGWGPVGRLMDPEFATRQFLTVLQEIPGWQGMELTWAAQAVQVSAFPYAYAQHEWRATAVVNAIVGG